MELASIGSPALWIGFVVFVIAMIALDLSPGVETRPPRAPSRCPASESNPLPAFRPGKRSPILHSTQPQQCDASPECVEDHAVLTLHRLLPAVDVRDAAATCVKWI